jgi:hypothetical protein
MTSNENEILVNFVMNFYELGDLENYLKAFNLIPLDELTLKNYCLQICNALGNIY